MTATDHEALFLRPAEAAKLAGLSTRAIYRAIQRGDLRATRLCSRLRIPRDAFDEWIGRGAVRVERPVVEVRTAPAVHGSFRRLLSEDERRRRRRTVPLLGPLGQDLADWRLRAGRPPAETLVLPGHDGGPWTLTAQQNWRRRLQPTRSQLAIGRALPSAQGRFASAARRLRGPSRRRDPDTHGPAVASAGLRSDTASGRARAVRRESGGTASSPGLARGVVLSGGRRSRMRPAGSSRAHWGVA